MGNLSLQIFCEIDLQLQWNKKQKLKVFDVKLMEVYWR